MRSHPKLHVIDNLDASMALSDPVYQTMYKRVLELRPIASRYIFDAEGSSYLGHFIRDCGDMILHNRQFAIPPYETMYLQINIQDMLEALGRESSNDRWGKETGDVDIGYLIHKGAIHPIAQDKREKSAVSLFSYHMNTPAASGSIFAEPIRLNDSDDEWARGALLLGTTMNDLPDEATRLDIIRGTRITVNSQWIRPGDSPEQRRHMYNTLLYSSMGDYRNVISALLLLNQTKHVHVTKVPWSAAIVRGKRRVFAAHNTVHIKLADGSTEVRRTFMPSLGVPRRRHRVEGHFAHWHLQDGCIHAWPMMPDVDIDGTPRWHCLHCNGLRVWRKQHMRGHSGEGYVQKDYAVTE